ncbi:hypothetical protein J1N35_009599 [Gossypium stocksii]|uniref:Uncharacterized protein n=1 Tax=Gossypium stocksii TaxID=47602 RepID=A0A9D3VY95_9ROSI|nr:hypothetical protein J1N35_009599 [Gossypium stocksii]
MWVHAPSRDLQNLPRLLPQWPFTLPLRIRRFLLKTGFQTLWFLQHLELQTSEPSRRNRLSSARRQELRELQFFPQQLRGLRGVLQNGHGHEQSNSRVIWV